VSSTGSDDNNCTKEETPCRTLASALTKVASGGYVDVITSGTYAGSTLTIAKSVTIEGAPGIQAVVAPDKGDGFDINTSGVTVVLKGLTLEGPNSGSGISFQSGAFMGVEDCVIQGWDAGISVPALAGKVAIRNTVSRLNVSDGLVISSALPASPQVAVDRSAFVGNGGDGVFAGVGVNGSPVVTVSESTSTLNARGFVAFSGTMTIVNSDASSNWKDGVVVSTARLQGPYSVVNVANTTATGNGGCGFDRGGGTFNSTKTNLVNNNAGGDTCGIITTLAPQ
jgi:hypothetical protein